MTQTTSLRIPLLSELPDFRQPLPRWAWTLIGASSIPLWAAWPALAVTAGTMPVFQILTVAFAVGWLVLSQLDRPEQAATDKSGNQTIPTLVCSMGLLGANALFILSTTYIPAAQANLISYLWPVMVVAFGAILGFFSFQLRHGLGVALGFAGAAVVIGAEEVVFSWPGILLAAMSGASWALFCLFRLWQGSAAKNVLAKGCLLSALFSFALHLGFEQTVLPSLISLSAAIAVGIAPLALANLAWDHGIRRGDSRTLAVMAYATPLVSALVLIAFGYAALTTSLLFGGLLIVGAGILSTAKSSEFRS